MTTVVENIRILVVVLQRFLEAVKRLLGITLLHEYAGELHPALRETWDELE